jgi:2-polyprenyl-3-methyl-5-hydroxy-6-metoxy-1,4-benzoquinol methylase
MIENISIENNSGIFEENYHNVRLSEQRIYSNQQIAKLPDIGADHVYAHEWAVRKRSSEQLTALLKKKKTKLNILEVGCGNGWLSAKLADIDNATVTGIDINRIELTQAVTTFEKKNNLHFVYGDIRTPELTSHAYDIIVFAASLQYFASLTEIITKALLLLNDDGEIHIVDTPLYDKNEIDNAAMRTKNYYISLGFEVMSDYYFHHSLADLNQFNYTIIYDPNSIFSKLKKINQPFYHVIIKQKK